MILCRLFTLILPINLLVLWIELSDYIPKMIIHKFPLSFFPLIFCLFFFFLTEGLMFLDYNFSLIYGLCEFALY